MEQEQGLTAEDLAAQEGARRYLDRSAGMAARGETVGGLLEWGVTLFREFIVALFSGHC